MTNLEYSDFYKFLSSLGVVLIGLALLLPWLFLREPFDTSIKASELAELTPSAQAIINSRQIVALWFFQNIIWISSILAIIGLGFLSSGIFLWSKKQSVLDKKEHLETEKLRLEIEKMSPTQIAEKVIKETEEEPRAEIPSIPAPSTRSIAREYFRIEDIIVGKLITCFGRDNVLPNRRVEDREYDIILLSNTPDEDVIFEIKATMSRFERDRVRLATEQLRHGIYAYSKTTGRKVIGIGFFILLGDAPPDNNSMEKYKQFASEIMQAENSNIFAYFLTENELANLPCEDLRTMIHPSRYTLR